MRFRISCDAIDNGDAITYYVDNCLLSTPIAVGQNPSFEGGDTNTIGDGVGNDWTSVVSNAELTPSITISLDATNYTDGSYSQKVQINASGLTAQRTQYLESDNVPVIPGDVLSASISAYVPNASGTSIRFLMAWYNASGTELSTDTTSAISANGAFTTYTLTNKTAPANAASVRFRVSCDGIDNGDSITYYVDNCLLNTPLTTVQNASFEGGDTNTIGDGVGNDWASAVSNAELASSVKTSIDPANHSEGSSSQKVRINASGLTAQRTQTLESSPITVTAGSTLSASVDAYVPAASGASIRFLLAWYNASGTELSNVGLPPVTTNTAFTTLVLNNQVAPANAASVRFRISCDEIDNGDSITYYVDNAQLTFSGGTAGVYYILADHLGGAYKIVDANGANAQTSVYYAFGESRSNPSGLRTDKLYTGQQLEPSSGLYQMGVRWYDPIIGRWLSPDSIVSNPNNPQTLNRYTYVNNNPLRNIDSSGHFPWDVTIDIISWGIDAYTMATEPSWENAGFLVVDTVCLAPGIPSVGAVRNASKVAKVVERADKVVETGKAAAWTEKFAGASEDILRGIQYLESRVNNEKIPAAWRKGIEAQLSRAEDYYKQGKLAGVEITEGAGRYDLVLVTGEVVEIKYWREGYASNNMESLANQILKYTKDNDRTVKLEFVKTKTNPITKEWLEGLPGYLKKQGVDMSKVSIELVEQ